MGSQDIMVIIASLGLRIGVQMSPICISHAGFRRRTGNRAVRRLGARSP
jgi:hypothetical protein